MLNPVLSNFRTEFSANFFPEDVVKKYDGFLFHKNSPLKTIEAHLLESIQQTSLPGLALQTVNIAGMNNTGSAKKNYTVFNHNTINKQYPGTAPLNEVYDSTVINISFKNTILNWMYIYEIMFSFYKRKRDIKDFQIILVMMDSAEIPMIKFTLSDCFISTIPGLTFAYNESFSETKSFDCGFAFNKFDVDFIVPNFDLKQITL